MANTQNYDFAPQFRNDYNVANDGVINFTTPDFQKSMALSNSNIVGDFTDRQFYHLSASDMNSGAFWVKEDGEIPTYKAPVTTAELYPQKLASIETASIEQDYQGRNSFLVSRPNAMKNAIMQKFDTAALFGMDEPVEYGGKEARSVAAKAGKVQTVRDIIDAYDTIVARGGRPVVVTPSSLLLTTTMMEELKAEQPALASIYQAKLASMNIVEVAPQVGATSLRGHGTVMVYDANLLYTAFSNTVRAETFNTGIIGSLKPMDGMTDGFGTANAGASANGETGMNLLTRAKEAIRVLAFGDYFYAGVQDSSAAKLIIGEDIPMSTNNNGTASDFYKPEDNGSDTPAKNFTVDEVGKHDAKFTGTAE